MTDEAIKKECESRFQGGHSRTQSVSTNWCFRSFDSAAQALRCKDESDRVFARRKVRGEHHYAWIEVKS